MKKIGILALEVASLMSKIVSLWKSLADDQISILRQNIFNSEAVKALISSNHDYLLALFLADVFFTCRYLARAATHLSNRCSDPVLPQLAAAFDVITLSKDQEASVWEYNWQKMDRRVKKMENFITASAQLSKEMELLEDLEKSLKLKTKMNGSHNLDIYQKVERQKKKVNSIRENSLWTRSYDYTLRMLVRSLFTIFGRIKHVFNLHKRPFRPSLPPSTSPRLANQVLLRKNSGQLLRTKTKRWPHRMQGSCYPFSVSDVEGELARTDTESPSNSSILYSNICFIYSKCNLVSNPPACTLGAAALAHHYAKLIILIEKFVKYPQLITSDSRDDLYNILPKTIRAKLRTKLNSSQNKGSLGDRHVSCAAQWRASLKRMLEWLAPMAQNMVKWQSERSYEQQHLEPRTNVLLIQTLFFADQEKTELAITKLLVGLNYICRVQEELQYKARLDELQYTARLDDLQHKPKLGDFWI